MGLFRKDPASTVDKALATIASEIKANERDNVGLMNRPRYGAAQQSVLRLGAIATPHVLRYLERLESAESGSIEKYLADDVTELLGKTRDPGAVPRLASLLHGDGVWVSVPSALAKTEAGTQVLLDAARSPEAMVRAQAMSVWGSSYRPAEVVAVLAAGLGHKGHWKR